jgi:hypothetical protein
LAIAQLLLEALMLLLQLVSFMARISVIYTFPVSGAASD